MARGHSLRRGPPTKHPVKQSRPEVERREKVAKEILEAMGFEEKRRSASFLEIKWQKELPIDIAMLLVAGKEFWERFEKPTASEAVAQATAELELESASVAGEEGEKLGPASVYHGTSKDLDVLEGRRPPADAPTLFYKGFWNSQS